MYKKSLVRIETENQTDISNPALNDIIATNNVVISKNTRERRLSRACKAAVFMISLGLVAIGIVILTLALANSHNSFKDILPRSATVNLFNTTNNSPMPFINQENLTTIANEQTENEHLPQTTVILTSNNLHTLTTENVHMSSSVMRTKKNENLSLDAQTMKTYPSLSAIVNDETTISTTIQTTIYNEKTTTTLTTTTAATTTTAITATTQTTTTTTTTLAPTSSDHHTDMMTAENELTTLIQSQERTEILSNNLTMSTIESNTTLNEDNTTLKPEDTSYSIRLDDHSDIPSYTMTENDEQNRQELAKNKKNNIEEEEDIKNNTLFS